MAEETKETKKIIPESKKKHKKKHKKKKVLAGLLLGQRL